MSLNLNLLGPFVRSVLGIPSMATFTMIGAGVAVLTLAAGTGYAGYHMASVIDQGRYNALLLAESKARAESLNQVVHVTTVQSHLALKAASDEATHQQQIAVQAAITETETPNYVSAQIDPTRCITYGLVRLLDAAVLGVDPSTLPLPSGQSNLSCTALTPADLARSVVSNYAAANANAEQLDALEVALAQQEAAEAPSTK